MVSNQAPICRQWNLNPRPVKRWSWAVTRALRAEELGLGEEEEEEEQEQEEEEEEDGDGVGIVWWICCWT